MMKSYGLISDVQNCKYATIRSKSDKRSLLNILVLKLLLTMNSDGKDKQDEVVKDLYKYASSQASFSAPYIKLE